jgi:hypothetical protein
MFGLKQGYGHHQTLEFLFANNQCPVLALQNTLPEHTARFSLSIGLLKLVSQFPQFISWPVGLVMLVCDCLDFSIIKKRNLQENAHFTCLNSIANYKRSCHKQHSTPEEVANHFFCC